MSPFAFARFKIALPSMSMLSTGSLPVNANVSVGLMDVNGLSLNAPPVPAKSTLLAVSVGQ